MSVAASSNLYSFGFAIYTSDDHVIKENLSELKIPDNSATWEKINSSIQDFERKYEELLKEYGIVRAHAQGHDSDNALVGNALATKETILEILTDADGGMAKDLTQDYRAIFNEVHSKVKDSLHPAVDCSVEFFDFPIELVEEFERGDAE